MIISDEKYKNMLNEYEDMEQMVESLEKENFEKDRENIDIHRTMAFIWREFCTIAPVHAKELYDGNEQLQEYLKWEAR